MKTAATYLRDICIALTSTTMMLTACSKPASVGDEYVGTWGDKGFSMAISQDGNHLLIKFLNKSGDVVEMHSGTVANGSLDIDGFGHVTYSPSENALLVAGGYLKRVH